MAAYNPAERGGDACYVATFTPPQGRAREPKQWRSLGRFKSLPEAHASRNATGDAPEEAIMEFELKGALKKYRRTRSWRRAGMAIMALAAISAPWLLDLSRTDTLICWLGAFTLWMTGELEMRLKTIQIRLAGMNDRLNGLTGRDPDQGPDADLILELNDW
jgi:hypothetical protein